MAIINLKRYYYPIYTKDTFMEVPDEVAAVLEEEHRIARREDGKKYYHKVYSLDASVGMENHTMFFVPSAEDVLISAEEQADEDLLLDRLEEALTHLTPTQARRLHARFALKKKMREIAESEGVSASCASETIRGAIRKLQKHFKKNGWARNKED